MSMCIILCMRPIPPHIHPTAPGIQPVDGHVTCDDAGEPDVAVLGHSLGLECGLEYWLGLLCELSNDGAEGAPRKGKGLFRAASPQYATAWCSPRQLRSYHFHASSWGHGRHLTKFLQGSLGLFVRWGQLRYQRLKGILTQTLYNRKPCDHRPDS